MKAMIRQEGEVFVIHLKGKIEFDSTEPFRDTVLSHLKSQKVVFNLESLNFVGSNGITSFIETMVELCNSQGSSVHFCNLSSEFQRIFEASPIRSLKVFENEFVAKSSFYDVFKDSPEMPAMTYDSVSEVPSESSDIVGATSFEDSEGMISTPDCTSAIKD